ncbi:hypothetical protein PIB30_088337 [Stylosanthes scabra]|uniref:Uncharacterized protein n=1 Tax=Stylosanthes scabra TaxID=79078 RepID=A0ABU6XRI4_9FABA|nr:hypothetical protein [Stylosanthes scabra]
MKIEFRKSPVSPLISVGTILLLAFYYLIRSGALAGGESETLKGFLTSYASLAEAFLVHRLSYFFISASSLACLSTACSKFFSALAIRELIKLAISACSHEMIAAKIACLRGVLQSLEGINGIGSQNSAETPDNAAVVVTGIDGITADFDPLHCLLRLEA